MTSSDQHHLIDIMSNREPGLRPAAMGRLAIIVGIDGAGKSTVVRRLASRGYQTSHWRMLRHVDGEWADLVSCAADRLKELRGKERTSFILRLVQGEWDQCIKPHLAAGCDVVADGFYLRTLAKEIVFGDGDVEAFSKACPLTGQELIVLVDVSVAVAVERKTGQEISAYECFSGPSDFAEFQARQQEQLLNLLRRWPHVVVDGAREIDLVTADVVDVLRKHEVLPAT